jgi:hypothetical protein
MRWSSIKAKNRQPLVHHARPHDFRKAVPGEWTAPLLLILWGRSLSKGKDYARGERKRDRASAKQKRKPGMVDSCLLQAYLSAALSLVVVVASV